MSPVLLSNYDWSSAAIGASVGFAAVYAFLKAIIRKSDDDFSRV